MASDASVFLAVAGAHLLAVSSPGPDFAMTVRQTLAHGRRAGVLTALGIATGIAFHVSWGLFGLGWLVERFPQALQLLRYGGGLFLLYMGVQALRARPAAPHTDTAAAPAAASRDYLIGLSTNLLNPKAMMFFIALCSAVLTNATPIALRLALGLWITATTALWFSFVAYTLGHAGVRTRLQRHAHWIDRAMGMLLVALGLLTLMRGQVA